MSENLLEAKQKQRQSLLAARKLKENNPQGFAEQFMKLAKDLEVKSIGCYLSFGHEPDTSQLIELAEESGIKVYCPNTKNDRDLEFVRWSENQSRSELGFDVPVGDVYNGTLDLVVVPALAVDPNGFRLGRGGGYFDKYLANFKGPSVALVFDGELVSTLPLEQHDIAVHYTITPTQTIKHQ